MLTVLPSRRPVLHALGLVIALLAGLVVAGAATQILRLPLATPAPLAFAPAALLLTVWAQRGGRWRDLGFRAPVAGAALWVSIGAIVVCLGVTVVSIAAWHWHTAAAWLAFTVLVAFVEETLFRGVVLRLLLARGWWIAWLGSATVFGLGHAANVFSGQQSTTATLVQIAVAFAWGLFTAASFARTGSLWPSLVFHALFDAVQLAGVHQSTALANTAVLVVLLVGAAALGLWTREPASAADLPGER